MIGIRIYGKVLFSTTRQTMVEACCDQPTFVFELEDSANTGNRMTAEIACIRCRTPLLQVFMERKRAG